MSSATVVTFITMNCLGEEPSVLYEKYCHMSFIVFCTGGNLMLDTIQRDEGRGRRVHKAVNHSHLLAVYAGHHYNGCVRPQSQTLQHLCKQQ